MAKNKKTWFDDMKEIYKLLDGMADEGLRLAYDDLIEYFKEKGVYS